MSKFLFTALLTAALAAPVLTASAATLTAQQQKMSDCSKQAASQKLSGQPRKDFMKTCLSSATPAADSSGAPSAATPPATSAKQTQQQKMKSCNADATAKGMDAADRKAYLKTCLSSSPAN